MNERELNRDPMEGRGGEAFKYDEWSWWGGEGEITWGRTVPANYAPEIGGRVDTGYSSRGESLGHPQSIRTPWH